MAASSVCCATASTYQPSTVPKASMPSAPLEFADPQGTSTAADSGQLRSWPPWLWPPPSSRTVAFTATRTVKNLWRYFMKRDFDLSNFSENNEAELLEQLTESFRSHDDFPNHRENHCHATRIPEDPMKHRTPWMLAFFAGTALMSRAPHAAPNQTSPKSRTTRGSLKTAPPVGRTNARMNVMQLERLPQDGASLLTKAIPSAGRSNTATNASTCLTPWGPPLATPTTSASPTSPPFPTLCTSSSSTTWPPACAGKSPRMTPAKPMPLSVCSPNTSSAMTKAPARFSAKPRLPPSALLRRSPQRPRRRKSSPH